MTTFNLKDLNLEEKLTLDHWQDPFLRFYFQIANKSSQIDLLRKKDKFLIDLFAKIMAFILIIIFFPIFLFVSLGIMLSMPGKIFYKQVRVGKDGKLFKVIKFRSMFQDAEKQTGHVLSWQGDPRITRFGKFLRKSHLDELPQLFNVLMGDMSFIGPRPERPEFTKSFQNHIKDYSKRHTVKPGITGLAQICCGYDAHAKEKLRYDLMYINTQHIFILDLLIIYHTARKMLFMQPTAGVTASLVQAKGGINVSR